MKETHNIAELIKKLERGLIPSIPLKEQLTATSLFLDYTTTFNIPIPLAYGADKTEIMIVTIQMLVEVMEEIVKGCDLYLEHLEQHTQATRDIKGFAQQVIRANKGRSKEGRK